MERCRLAFGRRTPSCCWSARRRAGLAPVELVLVLPVLMMVAALMLFAANAAVWKLRCHGAAREVAFQQIHPRTGEAAISPPDWRRPEVSTSIQAGPPVWQNDPFAGHTLFRGPAWQSIPINPGLFEGAPGTVIGHSQSDIKSGMWPQMGVHYRFQRDVAIFAGHQWQYDAMGINGHESRRSVPLLGWQ